MGVSKCGIPERGTVTSDVLIAGSGIVGCAAAYYLALRGFRVTVLEKEIIGNGGSCRNAGGIRQSARDPKELPLAMYGVRRIWPALGEELGIDIEYHQAGNIRLGLTEAHRAVLERLTERCRRDGLEVQMMTGDEIRELCPYVSEQVLCASWCPSDGNANPLAVTLGYYRRARDLGVRFITGEEAVRIETVKGRARRLVTRLGNAYEADVILIAAGYESRYLTRTVGIDLPFIRKYDECIVTEALPKYFPHTIGTADGDLYGHQTMHGSFVLGGDNGFEYYHSNDDEKTDATSYGVSCLARNILRYFPVLSEARIIRQWGGWLDKCIDLSPIVDEVREVPGLFVAAGMSGHGFGIAPAIALCLAQRIAGEETAVDITPLNLYRFRASV